MRFFGRRVDRTESGPERAKVDGRDREEEEEDGDGDDGGGGGGENEYEEDWSAFACIDIIGGGGGFATHNRMIVRVPLPPPPSSSSSSSFALASIDGTRRGDLHGEASFCPRRQQQQQQQQQKQQQQQRRYHDMDMECIPPCLTPLDMVWLADGSQDVTGNAIWTGAYLFLEALSRPVAWTDPTLRAAFSGKDVLELGCGTGISGLAVLVVARDDDGDGDGDGDGVFECSSPSPLVAKKGCSASAATMAMMTTTTTTTTTKTKETDKITTMTTTNANTRMDTMSPSSMVLTDRDERVLDLCRRNRDRNLDARQRGRCHVRRLSWERRSRPQPLPLHVMKNDNYDGADGDGDGDGDIAVASDLESSRFDTVIATDVLYDVGSLRPMLRTASEALRTGGCFILSHVPRASLGRDGDRDDDDDDDDDNENDNDNKDNGPVAVSSADDLERHIISKARSFGLRLVSTIRPDDLSKWKSGNGGGGNDADDVCIDTAVAPVPPLNNGVTLDDMKNVGAAILLFQKYIECGGRETTADGIQDARPMQCF